MIYKKCTSELYSSFTFDTTLSPIYLWHYMILYDFEKIFYSPIKMTLTDEPKIPHGKIMTIKSSSV